MAYDRHMGNLIQLFAVNSKSPAQQKPPDSSDLFRAPRQNIYLPLPLFCQGLFLGGFLRAGFLLKGSQGGDSSPGQKLHNTGSASHMHRVKRVHSLCCST